MDPVQSLPERHASPAKEHFYLLDGMRGVAAVAVVLHHLGGHLGVERLVPRGYLAVDFFFMLSGVVLAYAYENKLREGLGLGRFAQQRIIRLYPMIVFGTVLAFALSFFSLRRSAPYHHDLVAALVLGSAGLPILYNSTLPAAIFPINGPIWSIFFEIVANAMFAVVAKTKHLMATAVTITLISCIGLFGAAMAWNTLGVGSRLVDWPWGFARVGFSFFAGVMIFHLRAKTPRLPLLGCALAIMASLFIPRGLRIDGLIDLVSVIIVYPCCIAALSTKQPRDTLKRVCIVSGKISYPIYAIHYPISMALSSIVMLTAQPLVVRLAVIFLSAGMMIGASWVVLRFFDEPFRKGVTRELKARQTAKHRRLI